MAFDGITTRALVLELSEKLTGGRIDKIYQPEKDEVVLAVRTPRDHYQLLLGAGAEHARFYLTEKKPETPLVPPMFCMLFRKHFASGRITAVRQSGLDRIVELEVEAYNELSDLVRKKIVLEIMGRHSNLILVDGDGTIIDCVHHVGAAMSHFRMVLPGQIYEVPSHNHKADPCEVTQIEEVTQLLMTSSSPVAKSLYEVFNGISPLCAREICCRAGVEERASFAELSAEARQKLALALTQVFDIVRNGDFEPLQYRLSDQKSEYNMFPLQSLHDVPQVRFDSPSKLLDQYYVSADQKNRIRQKAQDLRHLVQTYLERAQRKFALQNEQMEETRTRDEDQRMGDLITANLYRIPEGATVAEVEDYYADPPTTCTVHLEANLTPAQNAQKYYARYNKLKRTAAALTLQMASTHEEVLYLTSVMEAMEMADCEQDLEDIRLELVQTGYVRNNTSSKKKNLAKSVPLEMVTSEGVRILVGKNNIQNDQLTFKTAALTDLWFHVKDMPGSHTILRVSEKIYGQDYTDRSIEEAAICAATHSTGAASSTVPVDYTLRRYVKKPSGAKPGFVIYTHQKTVFVHPEKTDKN